MAGGTRTDTCNSSSQSEINVADIPCWLTHFDQDNNIPNLAISDHAGFHLSIAEM